MIKIDSIVDEIAPDVKVEVERAKSRVREVSQSIDFNLVNYFGKSRSEFLEALYPSVLKRPLDESSKKHWLQKMSNEKLTKKDVFYLVRYSKEGRRNVNFEIRDAYYLFYLLVGRVPVLGCLFRFSMGLLSAGRVYRDTRLLIDEQSELRSGLQECKKDLLSFKRAWFAADEARLDYEEKTQLIIDNAANLESKISDLESSFQDLKVVWFSEGNDKA